MPEQLTPEQRALMTRVEAFVQDSLRPLEQRLGDDPTALSAAVVEASTAAGLHGLAQPAEYGGQAASVVALTAVREALARSGLRGRHYVLGPGPGFLADAQGRLRSDYLDPMMAGHKRSAFAFTDGRDQPPTRAREVSGGWQLDGFKSYVSHGAEADFFAVIARLENAEGSLFAIVDSDSPGLIRSEPFRSLDGSHHVTLTLQEVFVPADQVLGEPGQGMPRALQQIGDVRLAVAAEACGMMACALAHLEDHLQQPHRSGAPLGDREGVRLRLADCRIEAFAARSMLYRTARLADAGERVINEGIATKVFATEALGRIVDSALQLEGGQALVEGALLERLYREARALRLAEGASDLLRLNLARGRLELDSGRL